MMDSANQTTQVIVWDRQACGVPNRCFSICWGARPARNAPQARSLSKVGPKSFSRFALIAGGGARGPSNHLTVTTLLRSPPAESTAVTRASHYRKSPR